jgi:hypothetical protein
MTISKPILQNLLAFLERVQLTGKEAFALVEAVQAISAELNPPPAPPVVAAAPAPAPLEAPPA